MTWLSEIETTLARIRHGSTHPLTNAERMARVIRELIKLIQLLNEKYNEALMLHYMHGLNTVDSELKNAWDKRSSDIKELMDGN